MMNKSVGDSDISKAIAKAMALPVPLQYEAIEALLSYAEVGKLAEKGLIDRLVEELKNGRSYPHLKSICKIMDSMLGSSDYSHIALEPGIMRACISILKEEVEQPEPTSLIFPILSTIIDNCLIQMDLGGLKWYCKQITKGRDCVDKGMKSLRYLAMSEDSEILNAMANEGELINLLEKWITDSDFYSPLITFGTYIFGILAMTCNTSIKPTLEEFLVRPVLDTLKAPSSSFCSSSIIRLLLKLMDSFMTRSAVYSANGLQVACSLFQNTTGEQRDLAALAVLYLSYEIDTPPLDSLVVEAVAHVSSSITSLPFNPQLSYWSLCNVTFPLDLTTSRA